MDNKRMCEGVGRDAGFNPATCDVEVSKVNERGDGRVECLGCGKFIKRNEDNCLRMHLTSKKS